MAFTRTLADGGQASSSQPVVAQANRLRLIVEAAAAGKVKQNIPNLQISIILMLGNAVCIHSVCRFNNFSKCVSKRRRQFRSLGA